MKAQEPMESTDGFLVIIILASSLNIYRHKGPERLWEAALQDPGKGGAGQGSAHTPSARPTIRPYLEGDDSRESEASWSAPCGGNLSIRQQ